VLELLPMRAKLAWILPGVQLPLALFLLQWGRHIDAATQRQMRYDTLYVSTPALICDGVNAPARFLAAMSFFFDRVDHAPPTIFGLGLDYVFFLIGIVVLWFLVGRAVDNRQSSRGPGLAWTSAKLVLVGGPLALMGSLYFYLSLQGFLGPRRWNNPIGDVLHNVLVLLWSLVLLGVPALKLVRRLSVPAVKP
jgi:hypothetical protein